MIIGLAARLDGRTVYIRDKTVIHDGLQVVPSTGIEKDKVGVNVQSSLPLREEKKMKKDVENMVSRCFKGLVTAK